MIFSSFFYLLIFLPLSWMGARLWSSLRFVTPAFVWLFACSCVFFAWQFPLHLFLLIGSIIFNYVWGRLLAHPGIRSQGLLTRRLWLLLGVTANLALIGYFKYFGLLLETAQALGASTFSFEVLLPIGISFFTFQQIAYLVDVHQDGKACRRFFDFAIFVSFFPQLIAGPIVHHREILPQLRKRLWKRRHERIGVSSNDRSITPYRNKASSRKQVDLAVGITMLGIGLFKKVVLADQFAVYASPVFRIADSGADLSFLAAWVGALAWTFQLYFDFSGYSDMAVGSARLFGIRLPVNFHSPYQATNIIEFWRRWHITLSRFLRDYLYIPLGGGRCGTSRRYLNLMITMLLGGLWHGASWTFVAWGGVHGLLLCINHGWHWYHRQAKTIGQDQRYVRERNVKPSTNQALGRLLSKFLTFACVVFAWVLFRAETFAGAGRMISTMIGANGVDLEADMFDRKLALGWIGAGMLIVWALPNSHQLLRRYRPVLFERDRTNRSTYFELQPWQRRWSRWLTWRPTLGWAIWIVILFLCSLMLLDRPSEFIYYRF